MAAKPGRKPKGASSEADGGVHRNIARATLVLATLARDAPDGLRLSDVMRETGLSNATTHRLLDGLVAHGLADYKQETGRYFLGMKIFSWSRSARNRFGLAERIGPVLQRLADQTEDTAYFMLRVDDEALCLDLREGSFPLKTISVRVGHRWPLGVGAGALALLAFLPEEEVAQILRDQRADRQQFGLDEAVLRREIATARTLGYAIVDGTVIPGMGALGMPIMGSDRKPLGSLAIAAISSRLAGPRREELLAKLSAEARAIEQLL